MAQSQGTKVTRTAAEMRPWQWVVLALPLAVVVGFVVVAAGWQIHRWGISWVWAIITLLFVGWRWLLVRWTQPLIRQLSGAINELEDELDALDLEASNPRLSDPSIPRQAAVVVDEIIAATQDDPPIWEDWAGFWQHCQDVVGAIAHLYHPDVKYPLLNIHIPQAYGLIRGTVDDMDLWMQRLSPVLNKVSIGQAYQGYEMYRKLEPSARKLGKVLSWGQWLWNPAAAAARTVSQPYTNEATQQLLFNLSQSLREVALKTLAQQAIDLYSGGQSKGQTYQQKATTVEQRGSGEEPSSLREAIAPASPQPTSMESAASTSTTAVPSATPSPIPTPALPKPQTQALKALLAKTQPPEQVAQRPVNILLVGRTGAGKSSVINTLFQADRAVVDVLPSTDAIRTYEWQASMADSPSESRASRNGPATEAMDRLVLWDTPGYEQFEQAEFRDQVLDQAHQADIVLLVTPALDPALQMDREFLVDLKRTCPDVPTLVVLTQVDRLRPVREWSPPYDWRAGDRPKAQAIRAAVEYRQEAIADLCDQVVPLVTRQESAQRDGWNMAPLATLMVEAIAPAKQRRLARFLRDQEAQVRAASAIIKTYTAQMSTTQGLATLLKSPILTFLSTLTTGSPNVGRLLEQQIPVEQLPLVIGKLQMAYELFNVLADRDQSFNMRSLWPVLIDNEGSPEHNAWACGQALIEYWTQTESSTPLNTLFYRYFKPST